MSLFGGSLRSPVFGGLWSRPTMSALRLLRIAGGIALVATVSVALSGCGTAEGSDSSYPTGAAYAYLSNGSGFVPFNLLNHSTSRPIVLQAYPSEAITVVPSGRMAYEVTSSGVVPVNLVTGSFGRPISKVNDCQSIALDSSTQTLYLAGCGNSSDKFTNILPVSVTTGSSGTPIPVPGGPAGINISPDGLTAYVQTQGGATLTPVDLASRTLGTPIQVPNGVNDLAIAAEGGMGYATCSSPDCLTPINLKTGIAEKSFALQHDPNGIVVSPDGRTIYVTGGTYPPGSVGPPIPPDVTAINAVTGRVSGRFSIAGGASDIFNATS